MAHSI